MVENNQDLLKSYSGGQQIKIFEDNMTHARRGKRLERIASWEDNEMRKDPNTIYLFLSTLGKGLKQRITKAS
jgi:hypothetical protein